MNANCLDENGNFKDCPYRIITREYKAILKGNSDTITQLFCPCIGEKCVAYHVGICLRVYEALEKLKERENNA